MERVKGFPFPVSSVSTAAKAVNALVEVFVDGKPVMVEPGTTVLQVTSLIGF